MEDHADKNGRQLDVSFFDNARPERQSLNSISYIIRIFLRNGEIIQTRKYLKKTKKKQINEE